MNILLLICLIVVIFSPVLALLWYKIKNAWNYSQQSINPPPQLALKHNEQGEVVWTQPNRNRLNYIKLRTSRFFFVFKR